MAAVSRVRALKPHAEIIALEKGPWTSYSACGIPYLVGGEVAKLDDLVARTPQQFRDKDRIDVRTRHEVTEIDLDRREVTVHGKEFGRTLKIGFDQLLIGTGGIPVRPPLPGIDLPSVHGVQTLADAEHLLRHATEGRAARVAVVGGGYIGIEIAEAFVRRGLRVSMIEGSDQVMRTLDADMGERVATAIRKAGIDLRLNTQVTGFEADGVVTSAGRIPADLVVLGIGVAPNTALAEAAGISLGVKKSIAVDRRQRTSADGVYAAGDCCESYHRVSGQRVHIALGTVANKQARVAGTNLGGGYATFGGVLGTAVSKLCSTEVGRTGLTVREAIDAGFEPVSQTITGTTTASYLPSARPIVVKMVAEKGSGRVLGAQIIGEEGAAKRIDIVATALWNEMDVESMSELDLGYAPPFSPLWDPVLIAARETAKLV